MYWHLPAQVLARWQEGDEPRECLLDSVTPDGIDRLPKLPDRLAPLPASFLTALAEAARIATRQDGRFALSRLQLRGSRGQVVATDGRQLLIQGGFHLPWKEDLLLPALPAFGSRELRQGSPIGVGRTEGWVAIQSGPWTLQLMVDTSNRYPDVDSVIPRDSDTPSRLCLGPEDTEQLLAALLKLPGKDDNSPITLELGKRVVVCAREEGQDTVTELGLKNSTASGPPVQLAMDRHYLHRALQLGSREIRAGKPDRPVVCRDGQRLYLWMVLDPATALPPSRQAPQVSSSNSSPDPHPSPLRRNPTMPRPDPPPHHNGSANAGPERERPPTLEELISEAEGIRLGEGLREAVREATAEAVREAVQGLVVEVVTNPDLAALFRSAMGGQTPAAPVPDNNIPTAPAPKAKTQQSPKRPWSGILLDRVRQAVHTAQANRGKVLVGVGVALAAVTHWQAAPMVAAVAWLGSKAATVAAGILVAMGW